MMWTIEVLSEGLWQRGGSTYSDRSEAALVAGAVNRIADTSQLGTVARVVTCNCPSFYEECKEHCTPVLTSEVVS
jgi:hypothetical protein